ncbi:hypothetical protein M2322_003187 [Rhodoblastus acidophilus]|uniref:hypothetical protein n=1 Tax=Rhodoblastus acidophilus TaxID=1074 RepID=UPI0022244386|nr:hypothetical protein [Rhodoblastus acidophilus]MCW2317623.1 hypothetical protein [Rhodoblastus acidophilus]
MMSNALSMGPPPPPNPGAGETPDSNALALPQQAEEQSAAPAQQVAPPNHQQTVAALRHFSAIQDALMSLLDDPSVGKSDLKSKAIDAASKLVATSNLTPVQAVSLLSDFPDRAFDQKKWLEQHLIMIVTGSEAVLSHHQSGFLGQDVDSTPPDESDHMNAITQLANQYRGARNA